MRFRSPTARRVQRENTVPLINIVFLLLIFFLLTSVLAPGDPFAITPPEAETGAAADDPVPTLYLAADGRLSAGSGSTAGATGGAAGTAIAAAVAGAAEPTVRIKADAAARAGDLRRAIAIARGAGAAHIEVVTERRRQ